MVVSFITIALKKSRECKNGIVAIILLPCWAAAAVAADVVCVKKGKMYLYIYIRNILRVVACRFLSKPVKKTTSKYIYI